MFSLDFKRVKSINGIGWFILIIVYLVAMNFSSSTYGGSGLQVPNNISIWIGIFAFIGVGFLRVLFFKRFRFSEFLLPYLGAVTLLLLPLAYSDITYISNEYLTLAAIGIGLLYFFLITQFNSLIFKATLLKVLFLSALIQTIWGLIQYYFIFEPSFLFYRPDIGIPGGVFLQKNVYASYLSMGSLLALYYLFTREKPSKLFVCAMGLVVVANSHLGMLVEAKTGRVVPLFAVAIYLGFIAWSQRRYLLPLTFMLMALFFSFTPKQWFDVRPEQQVEAPLGIQSFGIRPVMYKLGLELVLQKPFTGHGIGQLHKQFSLIQGEYIQEHPEYPQSEYMAYIHNEPLQWMIQLGVVSGLAFIGILAIWIYGLKTKQLDPYILFIALPFVGHSMLELPFYHSAIHFFAFLTILALAIRKPGKVIKFSSTWSGVLAPLALFGTYKGVVFMLASLASLNALIEYKHTIKETSIEPLTSITPTSTFKRSFEHEIFQWKLRKAVAEGEIPADLLMPFIAWAEAEIKYAPFKLIYIQLTQSYMLSNDVENAKRVISEAHHIFPTDDEVSGYYYKLHPQP